MESFIVKLNSTGLYFKVAFRLTTIMSITMVVNKEDATIFQKDANIMANGIRVGEIRCAEFSFFLSSQKLTHDDIKVERFDTDEISLVIQDKIANQETSPLAYFEEETYTESDVIEIIRQVIFHGTPETYDNGGLHGNIKPTNTQERAQLAFEKYYLKNNLIDFNNNYIK